MVWLPAMFALNELVSIGRAYIVNFVYVFRIVVYRIDIESFIRW